MNTQPVPTYPHTRQFPQFQGRPVDEVISNFIFPDDFVWQEYLELIHSGGDNKFILKAFSQYNKEREKAMDYIHNNYVSNDSYTNEERCKFTYIKLSCIQ
jgi:hypothetical protein